LHDVQGIGSQIEGIVVAASTLAQSESTWHGCVLQIAPTPPQTTSPGDAHTPSIVQSVEIQQGPPIPPAPS
jgi:hypothetical protein